MKQSIIFNTLFYFHLLLNFTIQAVLNIINFNSQSLFYIDILVLCINYIINNFSTLKIVTLKVVRQMDRKTSSLPFQFHEQVNQSHVVEIKHHKIPRPNWHISSKRFH